MKHVNCRFCGMSIDLKGDFDVADDWGIISAIRDEHELVCPNREIENTTPMEAQLRRDKRDRVVLSFATVNPKEHFESAKASIDNLVSITKDLEEDYLEAAAKAVLDDLANLEEAFKTKYTWR